MDYCGTSLTVFFEDPFWTGIIERIEDGKLVVAKHVFGAEPTGIEILDFVRNHYDDLKFSPAVACDAGIHKMNPKRAVREARKSVANSGVGTKSQQALKLQHKEFKKESAQNRRIQKAQKAELRFELRQQKKKEKHRGK
ncbi:MAG: YjdF family protein [Treponema sp.]|nr:YjdF family protein [Treponema sp.]